MDRLEFGQVVVRSDGNDTTVTSSQRFGFSFQASVTLIVTENAHCVFKGFYDGTNFLGLGVKNGSQYEYNEITSISKSYNITVRFSTQEIEIVYDVTNYPDAYAEEPFEKSENSFIWKTNYQNVKGMNLSEIASLQKFGYNLISLSTTSNCFIKRF